MGATKQTRTLASLPLDSECEICDITIDGSNYIVNGYYTTDENEVESYLLITENQLDKYLAEFYSIEEVNTNTKNGKYLVMTDGEGENATFIPFGQFIDENKYDLFYNLIKEKSGKL
jgi:hypothetical protein